MRFFTFVASALLFMALTPWAQRPGKSWETISFESTGSLVVVADLYRADEDPTTPMVVLFHKARGSRGEYREIAPRLVQMGFNCLAVDLRPGGRTRNVRNLTYGHAQRLGAPLGYLDTLPEMLKAVELARERYAHDQLIVWGSSFSASLAIHLAAERPDLVTGVLAFGPGEYFTNDRSESWVRENAARLECPVFFTSARNQEKEWRALFEAVPGTEKKHGFVPEKAGTQGSEALWKRSEGNEEYWTAVTEFLDRFFPRPEAATVVPDSTESEGAEESD